MYSQVRAFVWDEGFHLMAAHLINAGKRPYIDFCFPQTLLDAYWNAFWMRVFGETWRVTHVFSSLFMNASVFLVAQFIFSRVPVARWRLACSIAAACLLGLSTIFVEFGAIAQAYAMSTFFCVAAFRVTLAAVDSKSPWLAALAGLLASAGAGSTLLCAPAFPVLLIWMFLYNRAGNRHAKAASFLLAAVISFAPEIWLFIQAPYQTFFNVVKYQAVFRRVDWPGASAHDFDVFTSWLDSAQGLLTVLLAVAAVAFIRKNPDWTPKVRDEFKLCLWVALALMAYLATCHPTFERYYYVSIPFVVIPASVGLYFVNLQMGNESRPFWPTLTLCLLIALSLGKELFDDRNSEKWSDYDQIVAKVAQVTPPGKTLFADELTYFLLKRAPPEGMNFFYSRKLTLPAAEEHLLHIVSQPELDNQIKSGLFDTVQMCDDDKEDELKLPQLYRQKTDYKDCTVYWDRAPLEKRK